MKPIFHPKHLYENRNAIADVRNLFTGKKSGHLGYLLYGPTHIPYTDFLDIDYWSVNQSNKNFYISDEEIELLKTVTSDLKLTASTMIDLGPGEDVAILQKSLPVLKKIQASSYIAVDLVNSYVDKAITFSNLPSKKYQTNFFDSVLPFKTSNALLFMAGSTITNIPVDASVSDATLELSYYLRNFRFAVDDRSHFLIGYDANQDTNLLNQSYNNKVFANVIENLVWRIRQETGFDMDPSAFSYKGTWIPEEHRFAHHLIVTKDTCVAGVGELWRFRAGQRLHVQNSYKFPVSVMDRAAENAGWKTKKIWTETGRVHYILLEAV